MKSAIITEDIWKRITEDVKKNPKACMAAVAFFATGAAEMLPFEKGSVLVVNASEAVVKSGQTNPQELIKLLKKGVYIYSCDNLHAKIFLIDKKLFIGSANVSNNSAKGLKEAMFVSDEKHLIIQARKTIKSLRLKDLGIERLKQLKKIYNVPKFVGGIPITRGKVERKKELGFYVVNLVYGDYPKGSEAAQERGRQTAEKKKVSSKHEIIDFGWGRKVPFKLGDTIFQIVKDKEGEKFIHVPGTVILIDKWKANHTIVHLECPKKRKRKLSTMAKKIDIAPLKRRGYKNITVAEDVLRLWN